MAGEWHGKMLITDKETHKQNVVVIDALAEQPGRMRLEVSSSWGIALASVAMNGEQLTYVLPRQHRYVQTTATAESMGRLISIPLDPHVLMAVLFGHTPSGDGWICTRSMMPVCKNETQAVEIKMSRDGDGRHLSFDAPHVSGQWNYEPATTKVEFANDTFVLNAPAGYKIER